MVEAKRLDDTSEGSRFRAVGDSGGKRYRNIIVVSQNRAAIHPVTPLVLVPTDQAAPTPLMEFEETLQQLRTSTPIEATEKCVSERAIPLTKLAPLPIPDAPMPDALSEGFRIELNMQQVNEHIAAYAHWAAFSARDKADSMKPAGGEESGDDRAEKPLTAREHQIAYHVAAGKTNGEIATALDISNQTVKNHISTILRKIQVGFRGGIIAAGFADGFVEQSKLSADIDYSRYGSLSLREKEVFDFFSGPKAYTNAEIAERTFLTEQTIKNHVTALFRKLGVSHREHVRLFALKRREYMASRAGSDFSFSSSEIAYLTLLFLGTRNAEIARLAKITTREATARSKQLFSSFDARTVEEAAGYAIAYGWISPEAIGINPNSALRAVHLAPDQITFLNQYGSFGPGIRISDRFKKMGLSGSDGEEKMRAILITLQMPDLTINSNTTRVVSTIGFAAEVENCRREIEERRIRHLQFMEENKDAPAIQFESKAKKPKVEMRPPMTAGEVFTRLDRIDSLSELEQRLVTTQTRLDGVAFGYEPLPWEYSQNSTVRKGHERARALEKIREIDESLYYELLRLHPSRVRELMRARDKRREQGMPAEPVHWKRRQQQEAQPTSEPIAITIFEPSTTT